MSVNGFSSGRMAGRGAKYKETPPFGCPSRGAKNGTHPFRRMNWSLGEVRPATSSWHTAVNTRFFPWACWFIRLWPGKMKRRMTRLPSSDTRVVTGVCLNSFHFSQSTCFLLLPTVSYWSLCECRAPENVRRNSVCVSQAQQWRNRFGCHFPPLTTTEIPYTCHIQLITSSVRWIVGSMRFHPAVTRLFRLPDLFETCEMNRPTGPQWDFVPLSRPEVDQEARAWLDVLRLCLRDCT